MNVSQSIRLLVTIGTLGTLIVLAGACRTSDPASSIRGTITNFADAKKHVTQDSYLQLVDVPTDNRFRLRTDEVGRVILESDLPRAGAAAAFAIPAPELKPGRYHIALQKTVSSAQGFRVASMLLTRKREDKPLVVEIREPVGSSGVDLGELSTALSK
jgi:hypothetical protein